MRFLLIAISTFAVIHFVSPKCEASPWYGAQAEVGSDIIMMDLRYPFWAQSTYYACWYTTLLPYGIDFYGGIVANTPPAAKRKEYRPTSVWSFWPGPVEPDGTKPQCVYSHPLLYVAQGLGEGASLGIGSPYSPPGIPWVTENTWDRYLIRTWKQPDGSAKPSYVGWWMKDFGKNEWHLIGVVSIPGDVTHFRGNGSFLEDTSNGGKKPRAIHSRLGYYRKDGKWHRANRYRIDAQSGQLDDQWKVELIEDDTVISMRHTNSPDLGRNVEPRAEPYIFEVKQPAEPKLDELKVADVEGELAEDGQLLVSWRIPRSTTPQLGYRFEVFDNAERTGKPLAIQEENLPHIRLIRLDLPTKKPGTLYGRLTIRGIFDRKTRVDVRLKPRASSMQKAWDPKGQEMGAGLAYELFESKTSHTNQWAGIHNWTRLPFPELDKKQAQPKLTGIAREIDSSYRHSREYGYALRFRGYLDVPKSGIYIFRLKSSDGSQLILGGNTVIDNDGLHSSSESIGTAYLAKGYHSIEVPYFKDFGNYHRLELIWEGPGIVRERIPSSQYFHTIAPNAPSIVLIAAAQGDGYHAKVRNVAPSGIEKVQWVNG